jgi:hypothetical protein
MKKIDNFCDNESVLALSTNLSEPHSFVCSKKTKLLFFDEGFGEGNIPVGFCPHELVSGLRFEEGDVAKLWIHFEDNRQHCLGSSNDIETALLWFEKLAQILDVKIEHNDK